jgi:hypothetical protein
MLQELEYSFAVLREMDFLEGTVLVQNISTLIVITFQNEIFKWYWGIS